MKIGYARVSFGQSNVEQLKALKDACDQVFEDSVKPGKAAHEAVFTDVLEKLKKGDTLVVTKLDRLGCSIKMFFSLMLQLESDHIRFVSISEGIDTADSPANYIPKLAGFLDRMDLDLVGERTKLSLAKAKGMGRTGGRPPSIPPEKILEAKKLVSAGIPVRTAAKQMGVSQATLYRHLNVDEIDKDNKKQ